MFKRVEKKRKRREEEEELGLDEDTKELVGLNDTDSDESDSEPEQESAQSDDGTGEDSDQEDEAFEDGPVNEKPPISVAEALKDPIYLVSLEPTVYGCVLCRGKLTKNAGMTAAHKDANAHKRRFQHFKALSDDADPHSSAWELVRSIDVPTTQSQVLSKRALKRQVKQAAVREKRKRHKELKAKAIAKKASKKLSMADDTRPAVPLKTDLQSLPVSQTQSGKPRKKHKLERKNSTSTLAEPRVVTAKSASLKKPVTKSRLKSTRKVHLPS